MHQRGGAGATTISAAGRFVGDRGKAPERGGRPSWRVGKRSGRPWRRPVSSATGGKAAAHETEGVEEEEEGGEGERTGEEYCGEEDGVSSGADAARALRTLAPPTLSRPDAYFAGLGTDFLFGQRPDADIDALNALFATVGFPQRDPTRLRCALAHSHHIVWVVAREDNRSRTTRPGQCVGFARATSDTVFNATIWDVVVSPTWQRCGIGRGMVERLVQRLVLEGIANVSLYAEPAFVGLYRDCGFQAGPRGKSVDSIQSTPNPLNLKAKVTAAGASRP